MLHERSTKIPIRTFDNGLGIIYILYYGFNLTGVLTLLNLIFCVRFYT